MSLLLKEYFVFCILFINIIYSDESPGFFLKISKNVPRIGRRDYKGNDNKENLIVNPARNVPRIGRRSQLDHYVDSIIPEEEHSIWHTNFLRPSRKIEYNNYNYIRPIDSKNVFETIADDINSGNNLKFISWKDFDAALENDEELFNKVHSLSTDNNIDELFRTLDKTRTSFVSLPEYNTNSDETENYFYRNDRSFDNNFVKIAEPENRGEKEKLEYHY